MDGPTWFQRNMSHVTNFKISVHRPYCCLSCILLYNHHTPSTMVKLSAKAMGKRKAAPQGNGKDVRSPSLPDVKEPDANTRPKNLTQRQKK
jgi:hypothetical protein